MSKIDINKRMHDTADFVIKNIKVLAKKQNVRLAHIDHHDGCIVIETESPMWVGDEVYSLLKKSEYGIFVSSKIHPGSFDWSADTYIKDAVSINFKV